MTRRLLGCERGNSFIEMALALPVLVILLVGMVDVSRAISTKLQVTQVAQRTVERIQRSSYGLEDSDALEAEAEEAAGPGADATIDAWRECGTASTRTDFTATCAAGEPSARYVGIAITKPFEPMFASTYFPGADSDGGYTLTGTAGVRIQ